MIKHIKQFLLSIAVGANVVTIVIMLVSGYGDHISPARHALIACLGMLFPFLLVANLLFLFFWLMVSWRRAWIPVIGFALAYAPIRIYMPLHVSSAPPQGAIKVISFNMHAGNDIKTGANAIGRLHDYLQQQDADLMAAQESCPQWTGGKPVFSDLFPYCDTVLVSDNRLILNFLSLHSRYPILRHERIAYTSATRCNGSVAFYVKVGADTIIVINNHLENVHLNLRDRELYKNIIKGNMKRDTAKVETQHIIGKLSGAFRVRAQQAQAIRRYIQAHRHYPIIVCGDFNDTPISYARRTIATGLTDCFVDTGQGLGLSYNQKGFNFRIDHILCSSHFTPYQCHVDSKMAISDHYPIICWLKKADNP